MSLPCHIPFGVYVTYANGSGGAGGSPAESLSSVTYAYDHLGRLVSDGGVAYAHDAAGNRTARNDGAATTSYALGAGDRLASWTGDSGGGTYAYDAAGNVTRIGRDGRPTLDLAWNGRYQLVSVSTNGAFAEGYAYDALGRRVSTTTAEGTVRHVYDDRWQVVADIGAQGDVIASYVWGEGIDSLLAVKVGGESYYPLADIQGTVWGYADAANNIVARWTYDAWGNVLDEEVSVPALATLRYRFQGREWSAATGLVNFRMRWYDPETGRWLSKDPIGLSGGLNLYCFCMDAPILYVDPTGELSPAVAVGVGIGVAYLGYIIYRHFNKVKQKMDSADIDDLRDVANKMIDCTEDTMATVTPLFGPPMPDTTLPLTDKATEVLVRPLWRRVFDQIRPSE